MLNAESAKKAKTQLHDTDIFGNGPCRVLSAKPRPGGGGAGNREGGRGNNDAFEEGNARLFLGGL